MTVIDPDAALNFLGYVEARHQVWEARQAGLPQPWTDEPIVASRKFTNVFRILDPGTQFIMTDLLEDDPSERDLLMRLFLYRHTGRTEVWEYARVMMGQYPTTEDLDDLLEVWRDYRGEGKGRPVFTGAYLVFPQSATPGTDKLESIINLTARLFCEGRFPDGDIVPDFLASTTQAERFATLRRNKGVADFMSMQILTDWGYTPHSGVDREDEFVVPGPGARKGAAALDPGRKAEDVLRWAVDSIRNSESCPTLDVPGSKPRVPSYMDVQNTLCEFSKYVRYASKPLPNKPYQPAHPGPQDPPVLPEHW